MNNAIGYIRVSTAKQAEQGQSLEAQEQKVIAYTRQNDLKLRQIFKDEGKSGRNYNNRPEAIKAIKATCNQQGTLIVYSLSRLGRSLGDIINIVEQLRKSKAHIISLTEPINTTGAMGNAFLQICGVFAELESNLISERVLAVNQLKRENGEKLGGKTAYGYTWVKNKQGVKILKELPEEQEVVKIITELWGKGDRSFKITTQLNQQGIKARKGGKWCRASVESIGQRIQKN